jgi:hypothetical protein|tara:strand:+ start:3743 stop:3943 length:201 start_codon:yes stop_codon:yes gene_type:complete
MDKHHGVKCAPNEKLSKVIREEAHHLFKKSSKFIIELMKGVEREWLPALADFRENFLEENLISLLI